MNWGHFEKHHFWLAVILLLGAGMRFYNYADFSLSNDELSALARLRFDSFYELLQQGIKIDGHPAFVQAFLYYWTKIFGNSVASVRFPFVVAGSLATLFAYLVASRWFGRLAGLLTAAFIATFQFPVLYSQIARPYSFGLLFTLGFAYWWTAILFPNKSPSTLELKMKKGWKLTGFILSGALCMYTHYFSFMLAGIIGLTGLLFLNKSNFKTYLLGGLGMVVLYLPHLPIFFYQLNLGGVGQWLGKPTPAWIVDHLIYIFNDDVMIAAFFGLLTLLMLIRAIVNRDFNKFHLISLLWFALPLAVGYLYSVKVNPVLQHSTLLFSFPFLIAFIFSFFDDHSLLKWQRPLVIVFLAVGFSSTVLSNSYYQTNHFAVFKELAQHTIQWNKRFGKENITRTINVHHPYYIHYYLGSMTDDSLDFEIYKYSLDDLKKFKRVVNESSIPYFINGYSNIYQPREAEQIIATKYPYIIDEAEYFNSGIKLYGKQPEGLAKPATALPKFIAYNNFDIKGWQLSNSVVSTTVDSNYFVFDENVEFGPTFRIATTELKEKGITQLKARFWVKAFSDSLNAQIVIDISNPEGQYWRATAIGPQLTSQSWEPVFMNYSLPAKLPEGSELVVYVWNPEKEEFWVDGGWVGFEIQQLQDAYSY